MSHPCVLGAPVLQPEASGQLPYILKASCPKHRSFCLLECALCLAPWEPAQPAHGAAQTCWDSNLRSKSPQWRTTVNGQMAQPPCPSVEPLWNSLCVVPQRVPRNTELWLWCSDYKHMLYCLFFLSCPSHSLFVLPGITCPVNYPQDIVSGTQIKVVCHEKKGSSNVKTSSWWLVNLTI